MKKKPELFSNPLAAIKFALMVAQEDNQDAIEFLQAFADEDAKSLEAWDFDGTFDPERAGS